MPGPSSVSLSARGELALIQSVRQMAQPQTLKRYPQLRLGIGDDCAVLRPPAGHELTVTTDLLLENTHFRRDWHSPESAGHRCLARGLSDLAAMGAQPLAAFLSVAVPPRLAGQWFQRFLQGLLALAYAAGVPLAGGDTAQAPAVSGGTALFAADIVLLGSVRRGRALLRSGAKPGDLLYVTGALGGSAAELARMAARPTAFRRLRIAADGHPQLFPTARLTQGRRLAAIASAALDLSDGLSTDLTHLCQSSGLGAVVHAASIPIHALARQSPDPLALALHGGEDYELLFTAPPNVRVPRSIAGVPITRIGKMTDRKRLSSSSAASRVALVSAEGTAMPLAPRGWQHFRSSPRQSIKPPL